MPQVQMPDVVFPDWLKIVTFAGRKTNKYTEAQIILRESNVVVSHWNGSSKQARPDCVLLDSFISAHPTKKIENARAAAVPTIDVEWVLQSKQAGVALNHKDFELETATRPAADDMEISSESDVISLRKVKPTARSKRKRKTRAVSVDSSDEDLSFAPKTLKFTRTHDVADEDLTARCAADPEPAGPAPWWESSDNHDRQPWVGVGLEPRAKPVPRPSTAPKPTSAPFPRRTITRPHRGCGGSVASSDTPSPPAGGSGHSPPRARKSVGCAPGRSSVIPSAQPVPRPSYHPPAKRQRTVAKPNILDKTVEKRRGRTEYDKPWLLRAKKQESGGEGGEPPQDLVMKKLMQNENTKHIPQETLLGIRHQILETKQLNEQGITFDDVHGLAEAKKTLHRSVILPRQNPKLFTGLRKPAKGLLLFGPPGNGKTMLAKAVAAQCNLTFFNISASVLTSKMVGDGEKNVRALFECARALAPSFVFLDEIDSLLTTRGGGGNEHEASRRVKTEFLVQLDGAGVANDNVLVMAATNRPMDLDDAVLRRLEKRVYVPLPDRDTRVEYCRRELEKDKDIRIDFTPETWSRLAEATADYSFSDLANLCRELALAPLDDVTNLMNADVADLRPINEADVSRQTLKIRKSVSDELLRQLLKWNEEMGSKEG